MPLLLIVVELSVDLELICSPFAILARLLAAYL